VTVAPEVNGGVGGVSVRKVAKMSLPSKGNFTEVTIELDPQFAPIPSDTRAILRQKTLLGESFVELTSGSSNVPKLPDGGHLAHSRTVDSTQIDEVFRAFGPNTRRAFRSWMQNAAIAVNGRGQDLNDAFGNLGPFASDATDILTILHHQQRSLKGLVRDTGTVFDALSARDNELAGAIQNSNTTFAALASRDKALADVIHIFPTFNEQTRLTLNRLATFANNTEPLVRDLKPVATDLTPTFQKVRSLSPHLKGLFIHLKPLLRASGTGLPALSKTLHELRPVLAALDPFLANLNPVIRYTNAYRTNVGDFLSNPPAALSDTLAPLPGQPSPRHALRQLSYTSAESLAVYPTRPATNRGNGYLQPLALNTTPMTPPARASSRTGTATTPVRGRFRPARQPPTRRPASWRRTSRPNSAASTPRRSLRIPKRGRCKPAHFGVLGPPSRSRTFQVRSLRRHPSAEGAVRARSARSTELLGFRGRLAHE